MKVSSAKEVVQYTIKAYYIVQQGVDSMCQIISQRGCRKCAKNDFLRHNDQIAFPSVCL